ncbi:MAG: M60 family metallopeptidase [Planctomycetota bacterium]|nr:M60 family metallopeptidase [Planctomycetota bacterium]
MLLLTALLLTTSPVWGGAEDIKELTKDVHSLAKPGIPGPLVIFGPLAFPVIGARSDSQHFPVVGAGRFGKGRFLAFGHGGYFGSLKHKDTATLFGNGLRWLAPEKEQLRIGALSKFGLNAYCKSRGHAIKLLSGRKWSGELTALDILILSPNNRITAKEIKVIHAFVKQGGGLIVSHLGWGWQQLNPKRSLIHDHPGNRLMSAMGLVWGSGYLDQIHPKTTPALDQLHAGLSLKKISSESLDLKTRSQIAGLVAHATRNLPSAKNGFIATLKKVIQARPPTWPPSERHPLHSNSPLGRLALTLSHQEDLTKSPQAVSPFPGAELFPGIVPKTSRRISKAVDIRRDRRGWISTGLYLNAGEVMEITVPKDALKAGLVLRVGAHSDRLWGKKSWKRHPEISRRFPIRTGKMSVATAHGGLIYIESPYRDKALPFKVHFTNVSRAPRYILGVTNAEDWLKIRRFEAPWAELETSKIILTIPSKAIRELNDPKELMSLWNRVLDCYQELGTRTLPKRPERMVSDRQISAGYMHSGYPIMTHLDAVKRMVDTPSILGKPALKVWGLWHELGHNHQKRDWTFQGTTEVTCNLFTLYVLDRISGVPPEKHPRFPGMKAAGKKHRAAGAPFAQWKKRPFLALDMYVELQQEFGWDLFKKVFAQYRDLPPQARPQSDLARRDLWLKLLSNTSGKNLGPFFQAWGIPVSKHTLKEVKKHPQWTPSSWKRP